MSNVKGIRDMSVRDNLIALYLQMPRLTYVQIAKNLDLTLRQTQRMIYDLQFQQVLEPRTKIGIPLEPTQSQLDRLNTIISYRKKGYSWQQIGTIEGVTKQACHSFTIKYVRDEQPQKKSIGLPNELKILYNQFPRLTYQEIADKMGIRLHTLVRMIWILQKNNLLQPRTKKGLGLIPTGKQLVRLKRIANMRGRGLTWKQISNIEGVTVSSIYRFATHWLEHDGE